MSLPARPSNSTATVFLTFCCAQRRRRFQIEAAAERFCEMLQEHRQDGEYRLYAFVVMPDHVHLLLTPAQSVAHSVQRIKGGYSRIWRQDRVHDVDLWQAGYTCHEIPHRTALISRRVYIEENPVRAKLCLRPEDYRYSSASGIWRIDEWDGH